MVLESLINSKVAERNPWEMFFIGFFYSSVALCLSFFVFESQVGLVMVFLTVLACTYLIQNTLRLEEKRDLAVKNEFVLLREHGAALSYFMFLFFGFVVSFSFWYIALPSSVSFDVFNIQISTISAVNGNIGGSLVERSVFLSKIFFNNLKVLFFTVVFAFLYGSGAVFILVWNASVVGVAVGSFVRNAMAGVASEVGLTSIASYFSSYSLGLLRYLTHGSFEILAYFTAALGAGVISVAVFRHSFNSPAFRKAFGDSFNLIVVSVVLLFFAALVEVFVTPALF